MTPGKPSLSDDRWAKNPEASLDRVHEEMEIIFHRVKTRPRAAGGHDAVPPSPRAREVVPARRRRSRLTTQVAALMVLGCALLAYLVGALASIKRSDTPAPRGATWPAAEASRAATDSSASEVRPAIGTTLRPEAGSASPRRKSGEQPTAANVRAPASAPIPFKGGGEAVVRAFYGALGRGDGEEASVLVVAEKRESRAFSPRAISSFYGGLPEPLRLTAITPLAPGAFRVSYRYSADQSRCDGEAVVSLTAHDGRHLIRSIRALNGC